MTHPFGDLVQQHLSRKHGLSQSKLAEGIQQNQPVISAMMRGQRLTGPLARERVLHIIAWLYEQGVLSTIEEANNLLNAAGMVGLQEQTENQLERRLSTNLKPSSASTPGSTPSGFGAPIVVATSPVLQAAVSAAVIAIGSIPPPPALLLGREHDIRLLKERLQQQLAAVSNGQRGRRAVIRGWPGVGKTALVAAIAHDLEVRAWFPDGTLWVRLGQQPNVFAELQAWARALGLSQFDARTVEEASARLAAVLQNRRMLLIIDDVWQAEHAQPFLIGSSACAQLITTRISEVAQRLASTTSDLYTLGILNEDDGLALLAAHAPDVVAANRASCSDLVNNLEGLPLALQIAGRLLRVEAGYGWEVEQLVQKTRADLKIMNALAPTDLSEEMYAFTPTVAAVLRKSIDLLDEETLKYFSYLGAFSPSPATFDLTALQAIWEVDDPRPIVRTLVDVGLLEPAADGRFWLHALLVKYARSLLDDE